jgi:hypothetical protein
VPAVVVVADTMEVETLDFGQVVVGVLDMSQDH